MSHAYDDEVVLPTLKNQLLLNLGRRVNASRIMFSAPEIDLDDYDCIIVCMSGGKDSIATLLHLLDLGVDRSKVELWHHDVDGREGSNLMDWHFCADYNRKLAAAFDMPLYFSWLQGGFEGEMLKENGYGMPHMVETPEGLLTLKRDTKRAKPATRRKFPQVSANLQTRWCSSALKIDVGRRALNNQQRFLGKRTLFCTGERREESSNRSKYNQLEVHSCSSKRRYVDTWRPVLEWSEEEIWDCLKKNGVIAPVPYRLGWGRSSCATCIFNNVSIWATLLHYMPERVHQIAEYEGQFGLTISRDKKSVLELAKHSAPMMIEDREALDQASKCDYQLPVTCKPKDWVMPAGAFNEGSCGPT